MAYYCDSIINDVENLHPKFLEGKTGCKKVEVNKEETKIVFPKEEGKEYSIAIEATVQNGDNKEVFIYKKILASETKNKDEEEEEEEIKNKPIFYIIMGSFAFVIIFVFIIIFCIINKRKKDNPDIDDEDYNKIPVLRETINEDES